jgi:DNA-directed RNA polymerase subunit RPC12/RpoP
MSQFTAPPPPATRRTRDPGRPAAYTPPVDTYTCSQCGTNGLEQGFIEDSGQDSRGYSRWIPGPLQRGPFGNAKRLGRKRWQIDAYRCPTCGHLELFAPHPV